MDLQQCRSRIDRIDEELVALFCERMKVVEDVAAYKKANNLPVLQTDREAQVLERVSRLAGPEYGKYAEALYTSIMNISKSRQNTNIQEGEAEEYRQLLTESLERSRGRSLPAAAKVACQGVEGAYSQRACLQLFQRPDIRFLKTFDDVFRAIEQGEAEFGVLPIENSTAGSVAAVYDLMKKHRFYICEATRVKVDHALLVKPGVRMEEVKTVYSHEQGLAQCAAYIAGHPGWTETKYPNTAAAAKFVSETPDRGAAAIASDLCAQLYGLDILEQGIQDAKNNFTRFICISKRPWIFPRADKISLAFTLPHRVGTLYQLISQVAAHRLNLTKLESRPIPDTDFEFMFYLDVEGSLYDQRTLEFVCGLHQSLDFLEFLGNYQEHAK